MALIDDNKEGWQKYLPTVAGMHILSGNLIAHREEFVGTQGEKQFTLDLTLGDGASIDEDGEGRWNGIAFVYYRGRKLEEGTDWHFYPGTLTTGTADPVQGEDPFFPGGGPYSGSARLTIKLPAGVADDVDTSGLDIIPRGIECGDYDAAGNRTEISYTTNAARLKVFALKRAGKLGFVNWPKFVAARDYNDGLLEWQAGDNSHTYEAFVDVPTYQASGNIAIVAGTGAASKPGATDAYDNYALTTERIVAGEDGYFKIVISGAFPTFTGGGEISLVDDTGQAPFRITWGNGHLGVLANQVPYEDKDPPYELPAAAGDEIEIGIADGLFYFKQNGVEKPIPQGVAVAPEIDLFGKLILWDSSAAVSSSEFSGQTIDTTTPVVREVKRFEAHPAFTAPTELITVLDFLDLLSAADTRMNAGKVEFLTAEPRASTFTLDDEVNLDDKQPIRLFEKPPGERPTQLFGFFRDTSDKFLREKPVSDVREQLFNDLGSHTRVGPLNFASMPESQAQRLVKFEMRKRSDRKLFVECVGMPSTYRILVGDVGDLLTRQLKREPLKVIVLKATRDPASGKRQFTLREYKGDDYRDDDHGHTQQAGSTTPEPSSTVAPPAAPALRLSQVTDYSVGGALVTKVRGTIYFPIHPAPLRAKVFVIKPVAGEPGTIEEDAGVGSISPASGTNQGQFDFVADASGPYTFRVQVETATSSPVPGGEASAEIEVGNIELDVPAPQALSIAVNGQQVLYTITAPATTPEVVHHYEISKTNLPSPPSSDIVYSGSSLNAAEGFSGTLANPLNRYVRAVDAMGNKSAWVNASYTGAALAAPTLAALSSSAESAEYSITPNGATNTSLIAKTVIEVATANTFGVAIVLTRELTGMAPTTGPITLAAATYYIRVRYVDGTGTAGTNSATATFSLTSAGVTDEHIQDVVGALFADGDVDFTYDDAGNTQTNVVIKASTTFALTGKISPAQLTANTDNWNPAGLSDVTTIRFSTDAARNITGLAGGDDGRQLILHNIGAQNAVLKDESASSTAANRFALNADVTLGGDQSVLLQYDATSSRWRLVAGPSTAATGVGGSTGATDNAILRADGTGGATLQASPVTIDDTTGKVTLPSGPGDKIVFGSSNFGMGTENAENAVTIWSQDSFRFRRGGTTVGAGSEVMRATGGGTTPASVTDGVVSLNVLGVKLIKSTSGTGDKMLWQNSSTNYGTGIEADNCVTQWSQDRHRWRIGGNSVTGGTETMVLTSGTIGFPAGTAPAYTPRTPGQITANQNNYNPGGQSKFQRWSSDASRDVTGLTFSAPVLPGEEHTIVNVGANDIVLKHQDANSTAGNRFLNSTAADITLSANQAADLIYDSTTQRWRVFKK